MESRRLFTAGSLWTAFAWGLAESTFFFVVPDVFLTRLALRNFRGALTACGCALAGALLGGAVLWFLAHQDEAPRLFHLFVYIPGIDSDLITRTGLALQAQGVSALFAGGLIGQPYKLFAVHAGAQNVPLVTFMLASVAARFARFTLTTTVAWVLGRSLRRVAETQLARWHALVWLAIYFLYFFFWALNAGRNSGGLFS